MDKEITEDGLSRCSLTTSPFSGSKRVILLNLGGLIPNLVNDIEHSLRHLLHCAWAQLSNSTDPLTSTHCP